jgi:hypothetical protein
MAHRAYVISANHAGKRKAIRLADDSQLLRNSDGSSASIVGDQLETLAAGNVPFLCV